MYKRKLGVNCKYLLTGESFRQLGSGIAAMFPGDLGHIVVQLAEVLPHIQRRIIWNNRDITYSKIKLLVIYR